jgi:hypothetical protein
MNNKSIDSIMLFQELVLLFVELEPTRPPFVRIVTIDDAFLTGFDFERFAVEVGVYHFTGVVV